MLIVDLQNELTESERYERDRIDGYASLLAAPERLLSQEAKTELNEAIRWSEVREQLIRDHIQTGKALIEHGYPDRLQQVAPQSVIDELNNLLEDERKAVGEFLQNLTTKGTLTVGPEVPA